MQRVLGRWVLLLAVLATCACSSGDGAGERTTIAVVPKGTTHEFWKTVHAGALSAGRELGVDLLWKGPLREDDRDEQIKVVEGFVSRGVDALVLAPLDANALVPGVREAVAAGIPVVVIDSDLAWDGQIATVATDNVQGGRLAARELGRRMEGRGRALLLRYVEGSASTMQRELGFLETLAAEYPEIQLVSSDQRAGATVEGAYRAAENLLNAQPDVDGVFCPCEPVVFGMLRALQDAGRAGSVHLVGFDATEKLLEALRSGQIDALIVQDPFRMGSLGVRAASDHLAGRPVQRRIDTGAVAVTRENLDEPAVRALLTPDLSVLAGAGD
jgi:ribose transport system substrate-binding protein